MTEKGRVVTGKSSGDGDGFTMMARYGDEETTRRYTLACMHIDDI